MKLSQRRLARPSLGGLLATRQGSLVVALLCAVSAATLVVFALNHYRSAVQKSAPQAVALVATQQIPKGTAGSTIAQQKLYRAVPMAAAQLTPGALSDAGSLTNQTAQVDILPGQQLTAADFAGLTTISETLAANQRAVSVSIGEAPGNTDVVQPGDHVDIYANFQKDSNGNSSSAAAGSSSSSSEGVILPIITDALVLKPATSTPAKDNGVAIAGSSMVLAVSADEVQPLISAATHSSLYLSLRPTNSSTTPGTELTDQLAQLTTKGLKKGGAVLSLLSKNFPGAPRNPNTNNNTPTTTTTGAHA